MLELSPTEKLRQERKQAWIAKVIPLNLHHPQLVELAEELYSLSGTVRYKNRKGQGRGLLIYGGNGSGKTASVNHFCQWFNRIRISIGPVLTVNQDGEEETSIPDCSNVSWPETVDGFKRDQWKIVDSLCNDYLTVIDDIGAEHDPSKIGMEKLYLILSRREFSHTIITTNFPPEDWEKAFERRIVSRLWRNFTHVNLSDVPDYSTFVL